MTDWGAIMDAIKAERDDARADANRLRSALRLVEWVEQDYRARKCGGCSGLDPDFTGGGHKANCPVDAALAFTSAPAKKVKP